MTRVVVWKVDAPWLAIYENPHVLPVRGDVVTMSDTIDFGLQPMMQTHRDQWMQLEVVDATAYDLRHLMEQEFDEGGQLERFRRFGIDLDRCGDRMTLLNLPVVLKPPRRQAPIMRIA